MCCVHLPRTTGGRVISRCRRWTSQRPQWSSKIIGDTTNTWRNLDFFQRSSDHQIGIDRISEYPTFSRDRIPPIIIWGPHFAVESGIRSLRTWRKPSTFRPITWRSPSPCRPTWCRRGWKRWKSIRMKRLERATVPWNRFWRSGKGWTGLQRLKERLKVKNWRKGRCNLHARCVAVAVFVLPSDINRSRMQCSRPMPASIWIPLWMWRKIWPVCCMRGCGCSEISQIISDPRIMKLLHLVTCSKCSSLAGLAIRSC